MCITTQRDSQKTQVERRPFEKNEQTYPEASRQEELIRSTPSLGELRRRLQVGVIPANDITLAESLVIFRKELTAQTGLVLMQEFYDRGAYISDYVTSKILHLAADSSATQTLLETMYSRYKCEIGSQVGLAVVAHSKDYDSAVAIITNLANWYQSVAKEDYIVSPAILNQFVGKFRKHFESFGDAQIRLQELCGAFGAQPNAKVVINLLRHIPPQDHDKIVQWVDNEYGISPTDIALERDRRKQEKISGESTKQEAWTTKNELPGLPDKISSYKEVRRLAAMNAESVPLAYQVLTAAHAPTLEHAEKALMDMQRKGTSIAVQAINLLLSRSDTGGSIMDRAIAYEQMFSVTFNSGTITAIVNKTSSFEDTESIINFFKDRGMQIPVHSYEMYAVRMLKAGLSPGVFAQKFEVVLTDLIKNKEMQVAADRVGFSILFARYLMLSQKPQDLERGVFMMKGLISSGKKIDTQYQYLIGLLVAAYLPEQHDFRKLVMRNLGADARSLVLKNRHLLSEEFKRWAESREKTTGVGWGVSRIYEDPTRRPINRQAGLIITKDKES